MGHVNARDTQWLSVEFKTLEAARSASTEAELIGLDPMIAEACHYLYRWVVMVKVPSARAEAITDYLRELADRFERRSEAAC